MNNGKPPANPFSLGLGIKTLSNLLCTRSTAQHMMMQETDDVSGELVMRCAAVAVAPKVIIYSRGTCFIIRSNKQQQQKQSFLIFKKP